MNIRVSIDPLCLLLLLLLLLLIIILLLPLVVLDSAIEVVAN